MLRQAAIGPGPHIWGLSAYEDVNNYTTSLTNEFLRRTDGPRWINEVGAINFFGRRTADLQRQGRVMRYLMERYPTVSRRLERMYVYHWRAAPGNDLFDSGLLGLNGERRPAFWQFFRSIGRRPSD